MDPNNISSGISIHEDLDESYFSTVSSVGMDLKEMTETMKKLEAKLAKNEENQCSGPSLMRMILELGDKFSELKKEMASEIYVLKEKVEKLGQENGKLTEENGQLKAEMDKMNEEFSGRNATLEEKIAENERQIQEINDEILDYRLKKLEIKLEDNERSMNEENAKIDAKNAKFEGQIAWLKEESAKLRRELRKIKKQKAIKEEQFAALSEEIDGLEECKLDLIEMKENKWSSLDCGPNTEVSKGELVVKHSGPYGWNCVHVKLAIPKFNLNLNNPSIAYFEVEILEKSPQSCCLGIGFCSQEFPMEGKWLGGVQNSIGICHKGEIWIDGSIINFGCGGNFVIGELIGIGIIHFPAILCMKCFVSYNGKLMGMADLPIKFATLQLFPTVNMSNGGDSIRANFGAVPFCYNLCQLGI